MNRTVRTSVLAALAGGLACVSAANADVSWEVLTFTATNDSGQTGTLVLNQGGGWWEGDTYHHRFGAEIDGTTMDIVANDGSGVVLGTVNMVDVTFVADPIVSLNFSVQANSQNTSFTVDSGLLSFANIASAEGRASAAIGITDVNGNGATLTPNGVGAYLSQYNGLAPTGTTFAELISGFSAGAFGSNSSSGEFPGGGAFAAIGSVVNISARFQFSLSSFDIASGTSTFEVVPAPATAALLGLGGLVAVRRRR